MSQSLVPYRSVVFNLLADADPGLLLRVLAPFARRDVVTDQVKARRLGDSLEISLTVNRLPTEMVHMVEGNLRQIVGVRRVEVVLRAAVRAAA